MKTVKYKSTIDEINSLVKARVPIIWVVTHEENRFIHEFSAQVAKPLKKQLWVWSSYQGLVKETEFENGQRAAGTETESWLPPKAIQLIQTQTKPVDSQGIIYVMRDMHGVLTEPVVRQIKDTYKFMEDNARTIVVVSPVLAHGPGGQNGGLPPTLEKMITVVHYELPTREQLEEQIEKILEELLENPGYKKIKVKLEYTKDELKEFSRALQGMTMSEAEHSVATSIVYLKEINTEKLISDKRQIIRKSQTLEFVDTNAELGDVGGLDKVKEYFSKYKNAFSDEAREFGVEPLRGVLLVGIPGCGKSLISKTISRLWKVPMLQLDIGKVMGSLVGQSEGKMRDTISQIEAMAPAVVVIDEIEKGLSGTKSSGMTDGGTLSRVFGTLLTAMQDGLAGVTIIATANDISALPPEFIRRFNEVFFVDLPGPDERWEIFRIHLAKRKRKLEMFQDSKIELLNASEGFTGAEIEKAIKDALAFAFDEGKGDVNAINLLKAFSETKPISVVMHDKIKKMREFAKSRARYASSWAESQNTNEKNAIEKNHVDLDKALDDIGEIKTAPKTKKSAKSRMSSLLAEEIDFDKVEDNQDETSISEQ